MKKKYILLALTAAAMMACRGSEGEVSSTQKVAFAVHGLEVEMAAPRRAEGDGEDIGSTDLTDLWLMEGTEVLAHQVRTDEDFGSPSVELTYGEHQIAFVASDQQGQQVVGGVWSAQKANNCYGTMHTVNVTGTTDAQQVVLGRVAYGLKWKSTDVVPDGVQKLRLKVSPMRESLTSALVGTDGYEREWEYNIASRVGQTISVTVYGLPEVVGTEEQVSSTIRFEAADGTVLHEYTKQVPVLSNRMTIVSGTLFGASAGTSVRVVTDWLTDYETSL